MLYLLRVSVPDRPGAFGVLASAIGAPEATSLPSTSSSGKRHRRSTTFSSRPPSAASGSRHPVDGLSSGGRRDGDLAAFYRGRSVHEASTSSTASARHRLRALAAITRIAPAVLRARGSSLSTMFPAASPSRTRAPVRRGDDGRRCHGCRLLRPEVSRLNHRGFRTNGVLTRSSRRRRSATHP